MTTTTKEQYGAYASSAAGAEQTQELDNRDIDRRALLNCAAKLNVAIADGGKDMLAYGEAIRHNQRLWTLFQVALCDEENPLPRDLKMTLLNLSRYVDRVSMRAVTEFAPQLLNSLIDINKIIAAGLVRRANAAAAYPPAQRVAEPPPVPVSAGSVMTSA